MGGGGPQGPSGDPWVEAVGRGIHGDHRWGRGSLGVPVDVVVGWGSLGVPWGPHGVVGCVGRHAGSPWLGLPWGAHGGGGWFALGVPMGGGGGGGLGALLGAGGIRVPGCPMRVEGTQCFGVLWGPTKQGGGVSLGVLWSPRGGGGWVLLGSPRAGAPPGVPVGDAECHRSLDLTGPLLLGGVPTLPESFPIRSRHFVGCMRHLHIDQRPIDMAAFIANNGTLPGAGRTAGTAGTGGTGMGWASGWRWGAVPTGNGVGGARAMAGLGTPGGGCQGHGGAVPTGHGVCGEGRGVPELWRLERGVPGGMGREGWVVLGGLHAPWD